jgi:single-stranded DNA-binding protein
MRKTVMRMRTVFALCVMIAALLACVKDGDNNQGQNQPQNQGQPQKKNQPQPKQENAQGKPPMFDLNDPDRALEWLIIISKQHRQARVDSNAFLLDEEKTKITEQMNVFIGKIVQWRLPVSAIGKQEIFFDEIHRKDETGRKCSLQLYFPGNYTPDRYSYQNEEEKNKVRPLRKGDTVGITGRIKTMDYTLPLTGSGYHFTIELDNVSLR